MVQACQVEIAFEKQSSNGTGCFAGSRKTGTHNGSSRYPKGRPTDRESNSLAGARSRGSAPDLLTRDLFPGSPGIRGAFYETMRTNAQAIRRRNCEEEIFMVTKWLEGHPRLVGIFLLILAALNGWISYTIFYEHPIMAAANAAMAVLLATGVILSWRTERSN